MIAIVTARGGSKGVLHKNRRLLCGKPLVAYSILAALKSKYIERCIVTTDDTEIMDISSSLGADVVRRPAEISGDFSTSQEAILHIFAEVYKNNPPEHFMLLQPTSPLRNSEHIDKCAADFFKGKYNCAISVTDVDHHPYKSFLMVNNFIEPLHDKESIDMPRQKLPKVVRPNGAIYIERSTEFIKEKSFYLPPAMPFFMDKNSSIDIDSEEDLAYAEFLMKK